MKINLMRFFRASFIGGLVFLLFSLWLDWYYVQVVDPHGNIQACWGYNPFFEWTTITQNNHSYVRPKDLSVPLIIGVVFIFTLIISAYIVIFKDIESRKNLDQLHPYAYVMFFLVVLNLFYIVVFPLFYLIPNKLYFPFLRVKSTEADVLYIYYIGPGYIMQEISFILIFTYVIF